MSQGRRLLVLDVEGTLFRTDIRLEGTELTSTIWQAIARHLGPAAEDEEIATHRRWASGDYNESYIDWMKDTILIHKKYGLSKAIFEKIIAAAEYNDGVVGTLKQLDRSRFEPVLISGGFLELAIRANMDLNISHAFAACSYLFGERDSLVGYNLLPCDFKGKIDFVQLMLKEYKLGPQDWVFVGDGKNDVHIAKEAPLSIGYQPHADLKAVATYSVSRFEEITVILDDSHKIAISV